MKRIGRPLDFLSEAERVVEATEKAVGEEHRDSKKRRTEEEASLSFEDSDQNASNESAKEDRKAESRSVPSSNRAVKIASTIQRPVSDGRVSNLLDLPAPVSFPEKIMQILDDKEVPEAIWWQEHGESFAIDRANISKVLDSFFQRSKYSSLTRKLNKWGFRRVPFEGETSEIVAYHHEFFRRGKPELLQHMKTGAKKDKRDKNSFPTPKSQEPSKLPPDRHLQSDGSSRPPSILAGMASSIVERASTEDSRKSEPTLESLIAQRQQEQLFSLSSAFQQHQQHVQQIQQQAHIQQQAQLQQQQQQQQGNSIAIDALTQLRARMASPAAPQLTQLNLLAGSIAPAVTSQQLANLPRAASSLGSFMDDPSNSLLLRRDGNLSQEEVLTMLLLRQNNLDTLGNLYWG